jgi:hypothetical protein
MVKELYIMSPHTSEVTAGGKVWYEYALMYQVDKNTVQFIETGSVEVVSYQMFLEQMKIITMRYAGLKLTEIETVRHLAPRIHK